jgi:hypothetical protein
LLLVEALVNQHRLASTVARNPTPASQTKRNRPNTGKFSWPSAAARLTWITFGADVQGTRRAAMCKQQAGCPGLPRNVAV